MKPAKIVSSFVLAVIVILSQAAIAFAAPAREQAALIAGTVLEVTVEADVNSGINTVLVKVQNNAGESQTVRVSTETAQELGLVTVDGDGNPLIVVPLPAYVEIDATTIIPEQDQKSPVASALVTFFSDIDGLDYDSIMEMHANGTGFGVIAQALWLTRKLDGDASVCAMILEAKESGDFSNFVFEDGTSPSSWGQFRKAVLGGDKKGNLGMAVSQKDKDDHGTGNGNPGNGQANHGNSNGTQHKNKDKSNNSNGNGNGNGTGNGNGNGQGNGNKP